MIRIIQKQRRNAIQYDYKFFYELLQLDITLFRHVWLTREDLDLKNKTGLELEELAMKMGHSISQQKKYIFMGGFENEEKEKDNK